MSFRVDGVANIFPFGRLLNWGVYDRGNDPTGKTADSVFHSPLVGMDEPDTPFIYGAVALPALHLTLTTNHFVKATTISFLTEKPNQPWFDEEL